MSYGKQEPVLSFFKHFQGEMHFQVPNLYDNEARMTTLFPCVSVNYSLKSFLKT